MCSAWVGKRPSSSTPCRFANRVLGEVKRKQEVMVYNFYVENKLF